MYHPNPEGFVTESCKYGTIGRTIVELSKLEFAHDNFVVSVNTYSPELAVALSKTFPRQFREKTDFVINAIAHIPKLRKQPLLGDGSLNLQWLQYQLDELYEVRAAIAHGSIFFTETSERGTTWRFDRYSKRSKGVWGEQQTTIGDGFMADVYLTASQLKLYFWSLSHVLEGRDSWEKDYKAQIEIIENRRFVGELLEFGVLAPESPIAGLFEVPN